MDIAGTIGTDGFDADGWDGPLMIDSDGDFIAAMVYPTIDSAFAAENGFLTGVVYPGYTQSTDGGETWSDVVLIHGNDGSMYPGGHTGTAIDDSIHYIGGIQDAAYAAFNNCFDQVAITSDGLVHLTYTMNDTLVGFAGIWHCIVDGGTWTTEYVGFTEDPTLAGASGVAYNQHIAKADNDHVVIGWTEYMQDTGFGEICMRAIAPGELTSEGPPTNVTNTPDEDEFFQRMVDVAVSAGGDNYYIDWIFSYYGEGGNFADSTLWHLQYMYAGPAIGIDDDDTKGPGVPRVVSLGQNYPNPFNPTTSISYAVDQTSRVVLEIMNLRGQLVTTLVDEVKEANNYTVHWDGRNDRGEVVTSGIYFYRLRTDNGFNQTKKMVLLK
jgi:hypothetical protein